MKLIAHRINYLDARIADDVFARCDGIEFDIRDIHDHIVVEHEPYMGGMYLRDFVKFCVPNKFYIVNVKSEGIEKDAIEIMESAGLRNFFLLDCGTPSIVRLGRNGERRCAARFSEFESAETVLALARAGYISWVWVDVFSTLPLLAKHVTMFHAAGLGICLVSPELQGQKDKIGLYKEALTHIGDIDAVCTKIQYMPIWTDGAFPCPS